MGERKGPAKPAGPFVTLSRWSNQALDRAENY
jgi:hypothetical protein